MTILFHSKKAENTTSQGTRSRQWALSDEWSDLRAYTSGDDSRDIVWKRSTNENTIISKKREFQRSLCLVFCFNQDIWDDFNPPELWKSRTTWKEKSLTLLKRSARKANFPFETFSGKSSQNLDTIRAKKIKNHLIIILASTLNLTEKNLKTLASQNDIVIIFIEHIFEKCPDENTWIKGKIFNQKKQKKYEIDRRNEKENFAKICKKYKISPLFLDTTQSIEAPLNNFFKYRYARKK